MPSLTADVIAQIIQAQLTPVVNSVNEVKTMLAGYEQRLRAVEVSEASTHPIISQTLQDHSDKIKEHGEDIAAVKTMTKDISDDLRNVTSILKWVLGVFTAVLISLIVAVITGKVQIVFK